MAGISMNGSKGEVLLEIWVYHKQLGGVDWLETKYKND